MSILGVIPARYGSSRFPGKPLAIIGGKPMIAHVYGRCKEASGLNAVVVATDDTRIFEAVKAFGGEVMMTSASHPTGTDRLLEVVDRMPDFQAYVNIQGDEPFIDPRQINQVCDMLREAEDARVATLSMRMEDLSDLDNPNVIKVVTAANGRALYFSRSEIPHVRDGERADWHAAYGFQRHIGIYGYTKPALAHIAQLKRGRLEAAESLEQLRWMEAGIPVYVSQSDYRSLAVDTPEDLEEAVRLWQHQG